MAGNRVRSSLAPPSARTALLVDLHWVDLYPGLISHVFGGACEVYDHRLVATSAWLIRRHLPLLGEIPLAWAPSAAAARAVLLERARTLVGRGFGAACVYGDPWLRRAVAEAGLVVVEQSARRSGSRSMPWMVGCAGLPRRSGTVGSTR